MLYQKILNKLDEQRGLSEELALISGYKNGQALRKALREQREFGSFNGLVKLVQELFPNEENQLLSEYALTLDTNKQTARCMLEYAEIYKLTDLRKELVIKMKNCSNLVSKQWAEIHEIDINYIKGEINYLEALSSLSKINAKSEEVRLLKEIFKAYCYFDEQLYTSVIDLINPLTIEFSEEREDFANSVIKGRCFVLLAECNARKGNINASRKYAFDLINEININAYNAWGNFHMGNSYMFENYTKGNQYFMKNIAETNQIPEMIKKISKRSVNFLDNVWKKKPRFLDINSNHSSDIHEIAFYYINQGHASKAIEMLNSENVEMLNSNQRGFYWYLKGLVSNNLSNFCKSVSNFKKSGDCFYCELPMIELKKLNIDDCIIEAMAA